MMPAMPRTCCRQSTTRSAGRMCSSGAERSGGCGTLFGSCSWGTLLQLPARLLLPDSCAAVAQGGEMKHAAALKQLE
jgi:hypothetical protein